MIGWFTRRDVEINPRKVPASLFSRDEGFGVDLADNTGSIRFDLLVDESHTLEFEASDHPIENGAVITDHVTQKLRTCTVTGMFTSYPDRSEFGDSTNGYTEISVSDGTPATSPRARDMFQELEKIAMQRKPVRLVTALYVYPEMIITSLPVKLGAEDGESVKFTMTLREFKVATLKKTVAFGKFRPPDMKNAGNRAIATKQTNGKVSAKAEERVDQALSGGGFNQ